MCPLFTGVAERVLLTTDKTIARGCEHGSEAGNLQRMGRGETN